MSSKYAVSIPADGQYVPGPKNVHAQHHLDSFTRAFNIEICGGIIP